MSKSLADEAFSPSNPAIVLLRLLRDDAELRKEIAANLGTVNTELDEDSFYATALKLEPPKGTA